MYNLINLRVENTKAIIIFAILLIVLILILSIYFSKKHNEKELEMMTDTGEPINNSGRVHHCVLGWILRIIAAISAISGVVAADKIYIEEISTAMAISGLISAAILWGIAKCVDAADLYLKKNRE